MQSNNTPTQSTSGVVSYQQFTPTNNPYASGNPYASSNPSAPSNDYSTHKVSDNTTTANNNSNNNADNCNGTSIHPKVNVGNPFPVAMHKRINRAVRVISEYLTTPQEQALIPESVFHNCKGLIFLSMVKGAYLWSGRFGSGLVISRLSDGKWSPPSAISCLGIGFGAQAGLEFTDVVIVLRDENSVHAFSQMGNVTGGASLELALGPWGRSAEAGWAATCALTYSFSKSRGLFGGLSLEGTIFFENRGANEKLYGKGATAREILSGFVSTPHEVSPLHNALETRFPSFHIEKGMTENGNTNYNGNKPEALPAYQTNSNSNSNSNSNGYSSFSNEKERLLNQ